MEKKENDIRKVVFSALLLALAVVLPILTGQIPQIGNLLLPMHIPVLLCGYVCGCPWGLIVGLCAPILRALIFNVPVLWPTAIAMAVELAAYGALAGFMYKRLPKTSGWICLELVIAMLVGRLLWGAAVWIIAAATGEEFTFAIFFETTITMAIPGIVIQLVLIPLLVTELQKAKLILND